MAYSKGYRVIQDHALGYQSINREKDNADAILDAYTLEHEASTDTARVVQTTVSTPLGPLMVSGFSPTGIESALGTHKSFRIPKAIVEVQYITSTVGGTSAGAPYVMMVSRGGWISSVHRVSRGWYYFPLGRVPAADGAFAEVVPFADDNTGTAVRLPVPRILTAATTLFDPGLHVFLRELDGGSWTLGDYGFSVALYAP